MAGRTALTPATSSYAGVAVTMAPADYENGNKVAGTVVGGQLLVQNGGGSPINVTIKSNGYSVDGMLIGDRVVAVAAGVLKSITIPLARSCVQSDTYIWIDWSDDTSVTCAVVK